MKTFRYLIISLIFVMTIIVSSCAVKQKQAAYDSRQVDEIAAKRALLSEMHKQVANDPCQEQSYDDEKYYRALGIGEDRDFQMARSAALNNAKDMLLSKLPFHVTKVIRNDSVVFGEREPLSSPICLDSLEIICERTTYDSDNKYHCFVTIQIPRHN